MDNFLLKKIDDEHLLLLCLNHNNIMSYINDIINSEEIKNYDGKLIIDQVLVVGNGKNRFISCNISNGYLDIQQSKNFCNKNDFKFRKNSAELLKTIINNLDYSILTDKQRELISEGNII